MELVDEMWWRVFSRSSALERLGVNCLFSVCNPYCWQEGKGGVRSTQTKLISYIRSLVDNKTCYDLLMRSEGSMEINALLHKIIKIYFIANNFIFNWRRTGDKRQSMKKWVK